MGQLTLLVWICILMTSLQMSHGVQIEGEQIRQLQNQLFYIEEKLNIEARLRRESVQSILSTLFEIKETVFKINGTSGQSPDNKQALEKPQPDDSRLTSLVHAMLKAFEAKKRANRRSRRHVAALIKTRIGQIESNIENQIQTIDNRMKRQTEEMEIALSAIKQSHNEILDNQNASEVRFLLRLEDLQTSLLDIKKSNEGVKLSIEDIDHDLKVIQNSSDVCVSEVLNRLNDLNGCEDGRAKTETISKVPPAESESNKFVSCVDLQKNGYTSSGVYVIYPASSHTLVHVYCDQNTDGGGWIVFQRREDGSEIFYRNWKDYTVGFGNLEGEFWLGNKNLHILTATCCHELRIDMKDFDNSHGYAKYSNFSIGSMASNYKLTVGSYTGDAGDSLGYHNNWPFTTYDMDNDRKESGNCAVNYRGAWWYNFCHYSNLNGQYLSGKKTNGKGVTWYHFKNYHFSLKMTEMKLR